MHQSSRPVNSGRELGYVETDLYAEPKPNRTHEPEKPGPNINLWVWILDSTTGGQNLLSDFMMPKSQVMTTTDELDTCLCIPHVSADVQEFWQQHVMNSNCHKMGDLAKKLYYSPFLLTSRPTSINQSIIGAAYTKSDQQQMDMSSQSVEMY